MPLSRNPFLQCPQRNTLLLRLQSYPPCQQNIQHYPLPELSPPLNLVKGYRQFQQLKVVRNHLIQHLNQLIHPLNHYLKLPPNRNLNQPLNPHPHHSLNPHPHLNPHLHLNLHHSPNPHHSLNPHLNLNPPPNLNHNPNLNPHPNLNPPNQGEASRIIITIITNIIVITIPDI